MIPLLHEFTGETVLVVGGGSVGARKARRFAREARVLVVSLEFVEAFEEIDCELVRAAPEPDDVTAWFDRVTPALVVAATDDGELNRAIEREARERGVLVNRTDRSAATEGDPERDPGDVVVPATVRDDPVVVAVATGGTSPALSRYLRERIEDELADAGAMAELTADLREELRDHPPAERRRAIRTVIRSRNVWKALRAGEDKPRQAATAVVDEVVGDDRDDGNRHHEDDDTMDQGDPE